MVYHGEQIMFKIKSNDGPKRIMEKKIYEQNTQWVGERRKYPNEETFAVRKLSFSLSCSEDQFNRIH